jgi:hypothetical protein
MSTSLNTLSTTLMQRCLAGALGAAISVALLSGCVIDGGGGYAYGGGDVDVGVDYYQPVGGVVVGGWGPGYRVGPPPRGGDRPGPGGDHPPGNPGARGVPGGSGGHAYRPAPPSHSAPSIPSHSAPSGGGGGHGHK